MSVLEAIQHNTTVLDQAGAPDAAQLADLLSKVAILASEKGGQHHQWRRKLSDVRIPTPKNVTIGRREHVYRYRPLLTMTVIPAEDLYIWVDEFHFGYTPGQGWTLLDQEPSREIVRGVKGREYTPGKEMCEVVNLDGYTHIFWYARKRCLSRGLEILPYDKFILSE